MPISAAHIALIGAHGNNVHTTSSATPTTLDTMSFFIIFAVLFAVMVLMAWAIKQRVDKDFKLPDIPSDDRPRSPPRFMGEMCIGFATREDFPEMGDPGKTYYDAEHNEFWRWNHLGEKYIRLSSVKKGTAQ